MNFSDKLIFLMKLATTSNKELADFLQVDPSRISQLRTGKRGLPRDKQLIRRIGMYFAMHTDSEFQCLALYETTGQLRLKYPIDTNQKAEILYLWLSDAGLNDSDRLNQAMTAQTGLSSSVIPENSAVVLPAETYYFGNTGKREAVEQFYRYLVTLPSVDTIYLLSDENVDWYMEDTEFLKRVKQYRSHLIRNGTRIIQILKEFDTQSEAFESTIQWLPYYINGYVTPYYYPRLRDGLCRQTYFCVPGKVCLFAHTVGPNAETPFTILTTDSQVASAITRYFESYLRMCRPALIPYRTRDSIVECLSRFLVMKGSLIQICPTLSGETMPQSLMQKTGIMSELLQLNHHDLKAANRSSLEDLPATFQSIDICKLATADEVLRREVPYPFLAGDFAGAHYYTPEEYVEHLKNILYLMETYPHYHFVPLPKEFPRPGILAIKEGLQGLMIHMGRKPVVYQVMPPQMIQIFQEYLMRIAEKAQYQGHGRNRIMKQLRELIDRISRQTAE